MSIRVGIVGVSGYGGGEVLRLCADPSDVRGRLRRRRIVSAGTKLVERFPGIGKARRPGHPEVGPGAAAASSTCSSRRCPTGESKRGLAACRRSTKIVDIGGDHRYVEGWTYGLADVWPDKIRRRNPHRQPRLLPRRVAGGTGAAAREQADRPARHHHRRQERRQRRRPRRRRSTFGFAEVNEDVSAYGLLKHAHVPEMTSDARRQLAGRTRGVAHVHAAPDPDDARHPRDVLRAAARRRPSSASTPRGSSTPNRPFVRVIDKPPHTQVGDGIEPGVRLLRRRPGARDR